MFQIREGVNEFLEEGNLLRVRIQWELARQMFQATIHQYDEVVRHHNVQMRAEIATLREQVGQTTGWKFNSIEKWPLRYF